MDSHRAGTVYFHSAEQLPFPPEPTPGLRIRELPEEPDQLPVLGPAFHSDDALAAGRDHFLRRKGDHLEPAHVQFQPFNACHGQYDGIILSPFQLVEPGGHIPPDIPELQVRPLPAEFPDPPGTAGAHHIAFTEFLIPEQHQGIPGIRPRGVPAITSPWAS